MQLPATAREPTSTHQKPMWRAKHRPQRPSPCAFWAATSYTTVYKGIAADHSHQLRRNQPHPPWPGRAGRYPSVEPRRACRERGGRDQWRSEAPRRWRPSQLAESRTARWASAWWGLGFASGRWRWAWGLGGAHARTARAVGESEWLGPVTMRSRPQLGRPWRKREKLVPSFSRERNGFVSFTDLSEMK